MYVDVVRIFEYTNIYVYGKAVIFFRVLTRCLVKGVPLIKGL